MGSYTANVHTAKDVQRDMVTIAKDKNIEFGAIVWDYADVMQSVVKVSEQHERITRVYHDIISVHKRLGCFGFSASHTKQSAKGKFAFDKGDYADAWGKSKACHACFYIVQDETEEQLNIARIGVVEQRSGVKFGFFPVSIDFERQTIVELDDEQYQILLEDAE